MQRQIKDSSEGLELGDQEQHGATILAEIKHKETGFRGKMYLLFAVLCLRYSGYSGNE